MPFDIRQRTWTRLSGSEVGSKPKPKCWLRHLGQTPLWAIAKCSNCQAILLAQWKCVRYILKRFWGGSLWACFCGCADAVEQAVESDGDGWVTQKKHNKKALTQETGLKVCKRTLLENQPHKFLVPVFHPCCLTFKRNLEHCLLKPLTSFESIRHAYKDDCMYWALIKTFKV